MNNNESYYREKAEEYEKEMTRRKELAKWLYDNCYDVEKNCIDLSHLDFTPFNCNVTTSIMTTTGNIDQSNQEAKTIRQGRHRAHKVSQINCVASKIDQSEQVAKVLLKQTNLKADRIIMSRLEKYDIESLNENFDVLISH